MIETLINQENELLLKASLLKGEKAVQAYEKWKSCVDINLLNPGETRLLCLLYHNLDNLGIKDELTEKFKGLARHAWLTNQRQLHLSLPYLKRLEGEGIPYCALKGLAMSLAVYKDFTRRSMLDIDLLIPRNRIGQAVEILNDMGYVNMDSRYKGERFFDFRHSTGFRGKHHSVVDLHAVLLEECCGEGDDHPFHEAVRRYHCQDMVISVPQPTELLFHTLCHGARWHPAAPIRWVADACAILERCPIQWGKLAEYALRYEVVMTVKSSLRYLKAKFGQTIPLELFERLPVTRVDRQECLFHASSYNSFGTSFLHHWNHYKRTASRKHNGNFVSFCRNYWGVEGVGNLVKEAAAKAARKAQRI